MGCRLSIRKVFTPHLRGGGVCTNITVVLAYGAFDLKLHIAGLIFLFSTVSIKKHVQIQTKARATEHVRSIDRACISNCLQSIDYDVSYTPNVKYNVYTEISYVYTCVCVTSVCV